MRDNTIGNPMEEPTRVNAVKALIVDNGKVLLMWDPGFEEKDKWETPGGRLEKGESEETGLHREVMEEAGIRIKIGRFLTQKDALVKKKNLIITINVYLCTPLTTEVTLEHDPDRQHTKFEWMDIEKAKKLELTPWLKEALALV